MVRSLVPALVAAGARAVLVTGSHARGEGGPHSDVDVTAIGRGPRTTLLRRGGFLVSLSWRSERGERAALRDPARAGAAVPAWRNVVILHDPDGVAARLREAANRWTWAPIEHRADAWVADEVTGLSEEVHKLVGNRDAGRLSAAAVQRSLLALRLPVAMAVHRRLLYETENALWDLVAATLGAPWARAQRTALGEGGEPFPETLDAALELFVLAADEVSALLDERRREVVEHARAGRKRAALRYDGRPALIEVHVEFRSFLDEFLGDYFRLYPVHATEIGNHEHDARWPDLTDAGRAQRLAFLDAAERRLDELAASALTRDDAIDRELLVDEVRALRFAEERLDEASWNPLTYVYVLGHGLFYLLAREFAPLEERLRSAAGRLREMPPVFDAARAALTSERGRRLSRLHTEKAIERMDGIAQLVDAVVAGAETLGEPEFRDEVRRTAAPARAATEEFTAWLRDELLPRADGDFRLGQPLYEEKLRHTLRSGLTSTEILARAEAAHAGVRGEMLQLARTLWPAWIGSEEMTRDADALVRRVLDAIAADHPRADELVDFCRSELAGIEAFVRERDVIGLTDEPLEITWTPEFLRSGAGAMLLSPGPLDRGQKSFFCITPMPEDWTPEQVESNLREDNARQLRLLTIHEAVPGHYLQLAYANRSPSLVRSIFASGVFAEGWAVYVTQVMMELGYGADDPALMLIHWKFYLRAITNAIIDIGIHAGEMDEEEAMYMMVTEGYQERSEAAEKWNRARLTSTQLCEYFVGSLEMEDVERDARRRAADEGRPFVYREHLESVLAHGTPPVRMLRRILFG